jgi:hypothetical protein
MLPALVSRMVSMTSFPLSFGTAITIASWCTSMPIPCGLPDYVEREEAVSASLPQTGDRQV